MNLSIIGIEFVFSFENSPEMNLSLLFIRVKIRIRIYSSYILQILHMNVEDTQNELAAFYDPDIRYVLASRCNDNKIKLV